MKYRSRNIIGLGALAKLVVANSKAVKLKPFFISKR